MACSFHRDGRLAILSTGGNMKRSFMPYAAFLAIGTFAGEAAPQESADDAAGPSYSADGLPLPPPTPVNWVPSTASTECVDCADMLAAQVQQNEAENVRVAYMSRSKETHQVLINGAVANLTSSTRSDGTILLDYSGEDLVRGTTIQFSAWTTFGYRESPSVWKLRSGPPRPLAVAAIYAVALSDGILEHEDDVLLLHGVYLDIAAVGAP